LSNFSFSLDLQGSCMPSGSAVKIGTLWTQQSLCFSLIAQSFLSRLRCFLLPNWHYMLSGPLPRSITSLLRSSSTSHLYRTVQRQTTMSSASPSPSQVSPIGTLPVFSSVVTSPLLPSYLGHGVLFLLFLFFHNIICFSPRHSSLAAQNCLLLLKKGHLLIL